MERIIEKPLSDSLSLQRMPLACLPACLPGDRDLHSGGRHICRILAPDKQARAADLELTVIFSPAGRRWWFKEENLRGAWLWACREQEAGDGQTCPAHLLPTCSLPLFPSCSSRCLGATATPLWGVSPQSLRSSIPPARVRLLPQTNQKDSYRDMPA